VRIVVPVFAIGLVIAACGVRSGTVAPQRTDPPPGDAVAAAAERTFAEPVVSLDIPVEGDEDPWTGTGMIDLSRGRFRVTAEDERDEVTVVGLSGEGFEGTFQETVGGPFGGETETCWMNPHAPVGFYADPISVEEAVRLVGAVVESLRTELASATEVGPGVFAVELERSAAVPADDFRDGDRRIWGDRRLLDELAAPIQVELADRRIAGVSIHLDYKPESSSWVEATTDDRRREVTIRAALAPSDDELEVEPPNCQAIE
jgi:hypothetical protein